MNTSFPGVHLRLLPSGRRAEAVRVLVIGGGAREHALVWKLQFCRDVSAVYAAPGNAGISFLARVWPGAAEDTGALLRLVRDNRIDLTIVGPEAPLAAGIVDEFQSAGLRIFGPTRAAARIEASKIWAKELMQRHGIPTAEWAAAADPEEARARVRQFGAPLVLKADGLAGGKGSVVCHSLEQAEAVIQHFMVERAHGAAGERIVVEEYLEGIELSAFALADGAQALPLIGARDYKPLLDRDQGPNTGGMGGYARPAYAGPALMDEVRRTILEPTVRAMAAEGAPFVGVLYAGLMLTRDGPKVLEYNCRWGDPEAELVLPLLKTDLVELLDACIEQRLDRQVAEWHPGVTCGIVLAARGYPAEPERGVKITGLDEIDQGVLAFHGATRMLKTPEPRQGWLRRGVRRTTEADVGIVTDGGRVLMVVATGPTLADAREKAYAGVERIHFDGMQYRRDIGLERDRSSGPERASDTGTWFAGGGEGLAAPPPDRVTTSPSPQPPNPDLNPQPSAALVAVLMGSESDRSVMDEAVEALDGLGISSEVHVMSAHRTPERVREFARAAEARGVRVVIAGAGGAAHLPGAIASRTTLPVIGVPIAGGTLMGLDSLLSIVQMPGGVPVATVAVGPGGARNAAYLAAAMLSLADEEIRARYRRFRAEQSDGEIR